MALVYKFIYKKSIIVNCTFKIFYIANTIISLKYTKLFKNVSFKSRVPVSAESRPVQRHW